MDVYKESIRLHEKLKGKLKITSKKPIRTKEDLSLLYTPGVAEPSKQIFSDKKRIYDLTGKGNLVAVVSDGSAVLGLGNIGGAASLPVMEGKCAILSEFSGIDAVPIVLDTQNPEEIIQTVRSISAGFGAINLEDISAPKCFYVEEKLQNIGIPVFHDDQHGTAIIVLAALINAVKVVNKKNKPLKIVISGAGAAGQATAKLLLKFNELNIGDIILLDSKGSIFEGRENLDQYKKRISKMTNKKKVEGNLPEVIGGADIFIGVSRPNVLTTNDVKSMAKDPIILAMANPIPEIMPDEAKKAGAAIVATGRSDFNNQVNNALAFPGVFKGALSVRAKAITDQMKVAAARAIAGLILAPAPDKIIPSIFDGRLVDAVAKAIIKVHK